MAESSEFITGLVDRSIGSGCLTFDVSIGILGKRQFGETAVWGTGGLGKWWFGEMVVGHRGLYISSLQLWDRLQFWESFCSC